MNKAAGRQDEGLGAAANRGEGCRSEEGGGSRDGWRWTSARDVRGKGGDGSRVTPAVGGSFSEP